MVHRGGEAYVARGEPLAGTQQQLALAKIEAAMPDMLSPLDGHRRGYRRAVNGGVFLDENSIGPARDDGAGEDSNGFTFPDFAPEGMASSRNTDQSEFGSGGRIFGADGLAVHG
jgi:hypothetical protein